MTGKIGFSAFVLVPMLSWGQDSLSTPNQASPANGSIGQPLSVTLDWDAVVDANRYHLILTDDTLGGTFLPVRDGKTDTTVVGLQRDKVYWWRVRAVNDTLLPSAWSPWWSIRTIPNPPSAPLPIRPTWPLTTLPSTTLRWF